MLSLLVVTLLVSTTSGCSLFVMAGKAIFGDPKATSALTASTGIDLEDNEKPVVIICSAPSRTLERFPSLQIDIVDRLSRDMKIRDIKVVPSGDVGRWYDDNGEWGDYSDLAKEFDAEYVVHVKLRKFEYLLPNSETLVQGQCEGDVTMHRVSRGKGSNLMGDADVSLAPVSIVFRKDFKTKFPSSYPAPRENRSDDQFVQVFMDRVAIHIGQQLYSYRMSESVH